MRKLPLIFGVLALIVNLSCISIVADTEGDRPKAEESVRGDRDRGGDYPERDMMRDHPEANYERLLMEVQHLREENRRLKDEIQKMRADMFHFLQKHIERQYGVIDSLRAMLDEQQSFIRDMLKDEHRPREMDMHMEMHDWPMRDGEHDLERDLMKLEREVERRPDDIELRMKLAHIYQEFDRMHDAFGQYKAILSINPDFDPAFHEMEKLREMYPDISGEPEYEIHDSVGRVISSNKEEIKLKAHEGDEAVFRVPIRETEDGSAVLDEELSKLTASLDPGARVKIIWRKVDDQMIIERIKHLEDEE